MQHKKRLVVLSGAGVSAESGLQTFRDSDGLWNNYRIEEVATPGAFARDPKLVLDFYNMRRNDVAKAKPNAAHFGLAALEKHFNVNIITQNIMTCTKEADPHMWCICMARYLKCAV